MGIERPTFGGYYNQFTGLTILLNDIETTTVWYIDNFNLDATSGIWTGNFYFEVTDHFGLDKKDALDTQGTHAGFAAWWVLQHRRDYVPFRVKVSILATLRGNINN